LTEVSSSKAFIISFPYLFNTRQPLAPISMKAIKGYYVSLKPFISLDHPSKLHGIPLHVLNGNDPSFETKYGPTFDGIEKQVNNITKKSKPHCVGAKKQRFLFSFFFIVCGSFN
jgi:hypothetical protein